MTARYAHRPRRGVKFMRRRRGIVLRPWAAKATTSFRRWEARGRTFGTAFDRKAGGRFEIARVSGGAGVRAHNKLASLADGIARNFLPRALLTMIRWLVAGSGGEALRDKGRASLRKAPCARAASPANKLRKGALLPLLQRRWKHVSFGECVALAMQNSLGFHGK